MTDAGYAVASLSDVERYREWIAIRRHFGISAFGVNAWTGDEAGAEIINEHDETSLGHEELYVTVAGHATFTVDGETIEAPAGTLVFVRDPAVRRGAVAKEPGTTVLSVGGKPGEAFRVSPWEYSSRAIRFFEDGDFEGARDFLLHALGERPDEPGILYNLACAEARLGEREQALEHLSRAVEVDARFAEYAQGDEDLASIRDDPGFPRP